jgi:hypothetical protein
VKVTLALPYVTPGGRHYSPDSTIEVDLEEGQRLLQGGLARLPDPEKPKASKKAKPASKNPDSSAPAESPTEEKD